MKDPFESLLLWDSNSSREVTPESLELLGREAASMYITEGVPLNDAIVKLASDNGSLENEHIQRVVEFANNAVFQHKFTTEDDKNVHFPVADPAVVLRDLHDGGSPAHDGHTMHDYDAPPSYHREMEKETVKTASAEEISSPPPIQHHHPIEDIYDLYTKLAATKDELETSSMHATDSFLEAEEGFYSLLKEEVGEEGAGIGDLSRALRKIASDEEIIDVVSVMSARLATEGIVSLDKLASQARSHDVVVNTDHPIFDAFTSLKKTAQEKFRLDLILENLDSQLDDLKSFITTNSRSA